MQRKRILLLASSIFVFPFTFVVFRTATAALGSKRGYLLGLGLYWAFALLMIRVLSAGERRYLRSILGRPAGRRRALLLDMAALLPAAGVFFVSFLPAVNRLSLQTAVLVLFVALLNGSIEELYWRGLYLKEYGRSLPIGLVLSTLLFTVWHTSLWYARGIVYQGGAAALMGGAFAMGLLWSCVSRKLKSIRICLIAHVLVNLFAFTGLFVDNGF